MADSFGCVNHQTCNWCIAYNNPENFADFNINFPGEPADIRFKYTYTQFMRRERRLQHNIHVIIEEFINSAFQTINTPNPSFNEIIMMLNPQNYCYIRGYIVDVINKILTKNKYTLINMAVASNIPFANIISKFNTERGHFISSLQPRYKELHEELQNIFAQYCVSNNKFELITENMLSYCIYCVLTYNKESIAIPHLNLQFGAQNVLQHIQTQTAIIAEQRAIKAKREMDNIRFRLWMNRNPLTNLDNLPHTLQNLLNSIL